MVKSLTLLHKRERRDLVMMFIEVRGLDLIERDLLERDDRRRDHKITKYGKEEAERL